MRVLFSLLNELKCKYQKLLLFFYSIKFIMLFRFHEKQTNNYALLFYNKYCTSMYCEISSHYLKHN